MKNNIDYTLSEKEVENKVKHWFGVFIRTLREGKINISAYRDVEPDIDLILNDIITEIADFSGYQTREDVIKNDFILDDQAKKALEIPNEISGNSNKIDETLEKKTKTEKIEGIDISFDELAERIGDLYYDSLSSFLSELSDSIDNNEIKNLLNKASGNISNAWDLCKVPTEKFIIEAEKKIKAGEKMFFKHTDNVKGLNIDNKKLANLIGNLVDSELSKFLEKLSQKMQKDGKADEGRKRYKLANKLYTCADKLNQASRKIK